MPVTRYLGNEWRNTGWSIFAVRYWNRVEKKKKKSNTLTCKFFCVKSKHEDSGIWKAFCVSCKFNNNHRTPHEALTINMAMNKIILKGYIYKSRMSYFYVNVFVIWTPFWYSRKFDQVGYRLIQQSPIVHQDYDLLKNGVTLAI